LPGKGEDFPILKKEVEPLEMKGCEREWNPHPRTGEERNTRDDEKEHPRLHVEVIHMIEEGIHHETGDGAEEERRWQTAIGEHVAGREEGVETYKHKDGTRVEEIPGTGLRRIGEVVVMNGEEHLQRMGDVEEEPFSEMEDRENADVGMGPHENAPGLNVLDGDIGRAKKRNAAEYRRACRRAPPPAQENPEKRNQCDGKRLREYDETERNDDPQ